MLKKLRGRFVLISMSFVLVMLCVIFALVMQTTKQNLEKESIQILQALAQNPGMRPRFGGEGNVPIPYFTVRVDVFGTATVEDSWFYDVDDEDFLREILESALADENETGIIPEHHLRYCKRSLPPFSGFFGGSTGSLFQNIAGEETYLVFGDISGDEIAISHLTKNCVLVGAGSVLIFLALSILLARWAVKPVDKAWNEQKQFISDASHELKTPLTVIMTNAELLRDGSADGETNEKHVNNILTMSQQMRGLVESLLELSRIDNGAVQKTFEDLNFSALTEDTLLPFEPLLFEAGLSFQSEVEPDICVAGSAQHLRQVVEILMDNACKYSVSPGQVQLTLRREDRSHCLLSLFSPGEPLTSEQCEKIFHRFYRVDEARKMNHSYGLGLAIAESIVAEHKGKIWCEPLPKGNVFRVRLTTE